MVKALDPREELFVHEFMLTGNAYESAIKAGYAPSTAKAKSYQWVADEREQCPKSKHHVWDEIQRRRQQRAEKFELEEEWVLKELRDTYLDARRSKSHAAAKGCLELMGKELGMFKDRKVDEAGTFSLNIHTTPKPKRKAPENS